MHLLHSILILFTLGSVLPATIPVPGVKGLTHLGSFTPTSQNGARVIDEFDYFISVVPATWAIADGDCRFFLGANATLVAIESVEEWDFLKIKLESYGSVYWTSGMYFQQTSSWGWVANNLPLPPFAPWDQGHPAQNPNPLHRVSIAHWNRNQAYWRTSSSTEIFPYICEIHRVTQAVPCYQTNDLIIVLDSSGSIGSPNYRTTLQFVDRLAAAFTVHGPSRIAFIIFSDEVELLIDLTNSHTRDEISSIILNTPYMDAGTKTWLGIDLAIAQFAAAPRDVPLNMVVLTDGQSNDEYLTSVAAQRATALGIRSFSVGITDSINVDELRVIAGAVTEHIFTTDTFDELINLLAPVSLTICPNK